MSHSHCSSRCPAHPPPPSENLSAVADVKPSNVLINTQGQVKMCDFGISGYLVDSVAKTMDAGCKPYMAVSLTTSGWWFGAVVQQSDDVSLSPRSRRGSTRRPIRRATTSSRTSGVWGSPW